MKLFDKGKENLKQQDIFNEYLRIKKEFLIVDEEERSSIIKEVLAEIKICIYLMERFNGYQVNDHMFEMKSFYYLQAYRYINYLELTQKEIFKKLIELTNTSEFKNCKDTRVDNLNKVMEILKNHVLLQEKVFN